MCTEPRVFFTIKKCERGFPGISATRASRHGVKKATISCSSSHPAISLISLWVNTAGWPSTGSNSTTRSAARAFAISMCPNSQGESKGVALEKDAIRTSSGAIIRKPSLISTRIASRIAAGATELDSSSRFTTVCKLVVSSRACPRAINFLIDNSLRRLWTGNESPNRALSSSVSVNAKSSANGNELRKAVLSVSSNSASVAARSNGCVREAMVRDQFLCHLDRTTPCVTTVF
mmetsp:Transcript_15899/g.43786  ORF Transcript_15899/g.43786 Transcript_15899/m.43786 type:complete len:233 (-) Transcript_15899:256-954(-)